MSDMSIPKHNNAKETLQRQQAMELRRLEESNKKVITKAREEKDGLAEKLQKDYEVQINADKSEYETKLTKMRQSYAKRLTEESAKFESSLQDLKQAQDGRVAELRENQEREVARLQDSHKDYMDKAKLRFEEEKAKVES